MQTISFTAQTIKSFFRYSDLMKHSNRGVNHHACGIFQEDQAPCCHYIFIQLSEAKQTQWGNSDASYQVQWISGTLMKTPWWIVIRWKKCKTSHNHIPWSWIESLFHVLITVIRYKIPKTDTIYAFAIQCQSTKKEIPITWALPFFCLTFWKSRKENKKNLLIHPSTASFSHKRMAWIQSLENYLAGSIFSICLSCKLSPEKQETGIFVFGWWWQ